ncbi:MAG: aminoacyl-tRNA hydrolase [Dehalococcoidia bacterium]
MPLGSAFNAFRPRRPRPEADEPPPPAAEDGPARPKLVVGLGNPTNDYGQTRHNVGMWCIGVLARRHHAELKRTGNVEAARLDLGGRAVGIAISRSFYNDAGKGIVAELKRLHATPRELLVIYDDLDLPVGRPRMRLQGSSGGNNGLKSIIAALGGSTEFPRIRIGIDRPYDGTIPVREPERIAKWVLSRPSAPQRAILDAAVDRVADAVEQAAAHGFEVAMNELNRWEPPAASA